MKSYDFEYDGVRLSDKGFVICNFDSKDVETISNGSQITFNTVSSMNGMKHELTSSGYEDYLTATFQICKNLCDGSDTEEISLDELRDIMRWLNRKGFHKFKLLDDEYSGIYFEASFNVSKIEVNGTVYGFELEASTNRPFGVLEPVVMNFEIKKPNEIKTFFSKSDEEGCIYPNMEITIESDGDFEIYSKTEDRTMRIENCVAGEVITTDYPLITSSVESHKIQNDFNWVFYRVSTTFKDRLNEFSTSLPCSIKITYSPIAKVAI